MNGLASVSKISLAILNTTVGISSTDEVFADLLTSVESVWANYLAELNSVKCDLMIDIKSAAATSVQILRQDSYKVIYHCSSKNNEAFSELQKLILALVGELLELKGYVRLHAAIYCDPSGQTVLIEGPSGSGKSTTSLKALINGGKIYTDEYTFWCNGRYYALALPVSIQKNNLAVNWPLNIAANLKLMNPLKQESLELVVSSKEAIEIDKFLLYGRYVKRLGFAIRVLLGLGNVQMWRYRFQLSGFKSLVVTIYFRSAAAIKILKYEKLKINFFAKYP